MPTLLEWTLTAIREETSDFSWMEEYRYDWVPIVQSVVQRIAEGQTVMVLTDPKRRWLEHYILNAINDPAKKRPFLPVYSMRSLFADLQAIETNEHMVLLEDMLDISYPQGYLIWYVGEGVHPYAKLVHHRENNFAWLVDEPMSGNFILRQSDPLLDIKMLQLYRLFDKSIEATLYGQVELS